MLQNNLFRRISIVNETQEAIKINSTADTKEDAGQQISSFIHQQKEYISLITSFSTFYILFHTPTHITNIPIIL